VSDAVRMVFAVHLHQPVGNFDHVFEQHVRDVYRPLLEHAAAARFFPLTLHVSGPLLEWLERHDPKLLDTIGGHVAEGQVEMLLAGFDEPVLASLPRIDRHEQVARMRTYLDQRFGVTASGLWLTERVWVPELAADLHDAGVGYVLVDDRHFIAAGFERDALHRPHRTESDGRGVALLAIDERLRYNIPFRPPEETAAYLGELRQRGHGLVVFADDGEKFGGWPGTREWVYEKGWLNRFFDTLRPLMERGELRLVSGATAVREVESGGLAYLPMASYREMEGWALPPHAQHRLARLEHELGEERMKANEGLVRGSHWMNFLVKYSEANRMHKTMVALSRLCRQRGDPPRARRAIGRAQCNDAYWHGVFGGLYLPHLRHAIWQQLAIAERALRAGEGLAIESLDFDSDGEEEFWVHSAEFSALVSPRRGGAVETFVDFAAQANLADVLTRRRESYHEQHGHGGANDPAPATLPAADAEPRALFVDRMLPRGLDEAALERGGYRALASWAGVRFAPIVRAGPEEVRITLRSDTLEKTLAFFFDGTLRASWRWDPAAFEEGAFFTTELSLARPVEIATPHAAGVWRYDIRTVGKSERGLEQTDQGIALVPHWPVALGKARMELLPATL
jgi:4-alpha-glucanotransferase